MSLLGDHVPTHRTQLRVRYEETDQMGVVYHANYLRYFEVGRTELLRHRGLTYRLLEERGTLLAVISCEVRYRGAAQYDDLIDVTTRLTELTKLRARFDYALERDGALLVDGSTVLVCLDDRRKPRRFPPDLVERLTAAEADLACDGHADAGA